MIPACCAFTTLNAEVNNVIPSPDTTMPEIANSRRLSESTEEILPNEIAGARSSTEIIR